MYYFTVNKEWLSKSAISLLEQNEAQRVENTVYFAN